ncbi:uncharacterized protein LOC110893506 [Helianthus annuus]|uniref:uncharacterized protein LOC110893506 n=1 Tax=Helianthus annuus TaxID=4232 RepID=UPI000B8FF3FC|nr:uncharacterized protein LOC110893506 [Helianthus annuus]
MELKNLLGLEAIGLEIFDDIISLDWVSKNGVEVVCHEKVVRILLVNDETLIVHDLHTDDARALDLMRRKTVTFHIGYESAEVSPERLHSLPCSYCRQGDQGTKEPRLEDIPIIKEFSEVFPKDLTRLSPQRRVEFRIDLVLGVAPVVRAPYRLAPSEMQELSSQLQELLDKGTHQSEPLTLGSPSVIR